MKKIISVVGARPQFIKHAPMQLQLQKHFNALTIHTGQHYDENMSSIFFDELNIPKPNYMFDLGEAKMQGEQTALMMVEIEKVCNIEKPDALLVYGDTNSTLAATLVGVKMHIPIIHIEAGLRSYNRKMPEEINRIIADEFSYLLFCPSQNAVDNLKKEGINHDKIFICGDVMCDMLEMVKPKAKPILNYPYYFATIHRPYNTDDSVRLRKIIETLNNLDKKVMFTIHPRTLSKLKQMGLQTANYSNIVFIPPVNYTDSISYQMFSNAVITDSGGMQKEAYMLKKKCITLRSETEWVETLQNGWNTLVFENLFELPKLLSQEIVGTYITGLYGDGNTAVEIVNKIKSNM